MSTPVTRDITHFSRLKSFFENPNQQEAKPEAKDITKTKIQALKSKFEKPADTNASAKIKQKQVTLLPSAAMVSPPRVEPEVALVPIVSPAANTVADPLPTPLTPAAMSSSPSHISVPNNNIELQKRSIAENYVNDVLEKSTEKFDVIIHSHASWTETSTLLEALRDKYFAFEKDKRHLKSFLDKIRNRQNLQAARAPAVNALVAAKQNIVVPAGKKDSMKGPTILGARYINQLLESSAQNFNEAEAERILDSYTWNIETLKQLTIGRIKDCEESQITLMEFTNRFHQKFGNNLEDGHMALINEIIGIGRASSNARINILSRLIARKTVKHLNFMNAEPVELRTLTEYAAIRKNIVKNRISDSELVKIASDLKNRAICLLKAIPETEFLLASQEQRNITNMFHHSSRITNFVTSEMLSCEKPKHRARLYKFFLRLCVESSKQNDLHTAQALVKAILGGPVDRLYHTKAKVQEKRSGRKLMEEVGEINLFFIQRFIQLKESIQSREQCVPPILIFMNGWANVSEFNKAKFIPDTIVPRSKSDKCHREHAVFL